MSRDGCLLSPWTEWTQQIRVGLLSDFFLNLMRIWSKRESRLLPSLLSNSHLKYLRGARTERRSERGTGREARAQTDRQTLREERKSAEIKRTRDRRKRMEI